MKSKLIMGEKSRGKKTVDGLYYIVCPEHTNAIRVYLEYICTTVGTFSSKIRQKALKSD